MESLNLVLDRLRSAMPVPMSRIRGVSGSGQQHGSVYWNKDAEALLRSLDPDKALVDQLAAALAHEFSPNWQDQSTQDQCDAFDDALGDREELARATGSGAHHVCVEPTTLLPSSSASPPLALRLDELPPPGALLLGLETRQAASTGQFGEEGAWDNAPGRAANCSGTLTSSFFCSDSLAPKSCV